MVSDSSKSSNSTSTKNDGGDGDDGDGESSFFIDVLLTAVKGTLLLLLLSEDDDDFDCDKADCHGKKEPDVAASR